MKAQDRQRFRLPKTTVLLVPLFLLAFGLRVYRLGDKNVWYDEGLAAWAARQSFSEIAQWTSADVHPPLYFWMLRLWRWVSGDSEFGLRLLSAAIGVLTVVATYHLGKLVGGPGVAVLAALLVGISRFDVWWSQEMRMYALAALLAPLSLWAAIRFWDEDRLVDGVLYVLFTAAGLYTLYLYVSVLVVVNLVWLWVFARTERRWRALIRWGSAQVLVLALFWPWLIYTLGRIPTWSSASPVRLGTFLRIYWTVLTVGVPVSVESYGWLTIPVLVVFVAGLAMIFWTARRTWPVGRNAGLLLAGLLLPAGAVYAVSLPRQTFFYSPQLAPRYLLVFAPAFYALLAWGMMSIGGGRRRLLGVVLILFVVAVAVYGLWGYYPGRVLHDDYKSLAATLYAYRHPKDGVVLYTDKDWPVFVYHYPEQWQGVPYAQLITSEFAEVHLSSMWQDYQGIWLVITPYAAVNDPQGEIASWLEDRAAGVEEHRFADKVLRFYARTEERASSIHELAPGTEVPYPMEADLSPGMQLAGYELSLKTYHSGEPIHLFLYWNGVTGKKAQAAGFELSLVDRHGQVAKRVEAAVPDSVAEGNPVRQQVDVTVPPDARGGSYVFAIRSSSGGRMAQFGRVLIRRQPRPALTAADVSIAHTLEANFGGSVRLLGYEVETMSLKPGGMLYLALYWQAREPVERRYKVFTHVLGEVFNAESANFLWGQQDNEPVGGTRPTPTWRPGEVIADSYAISLHPKAPAGSYAIEIGLYDPATGERLPVLDERGQVMADHLVLTHLTMKGR